MNKVLSNEKTIAIFILPTFLLYGVFVPIPIIYNICLSMFQADLMGKKNSILFRNHINLLNDKIFLKALRNNGMLMAGSLFAHLPLALLFGNSIFIKIRRSRFFQSIFFLPSVICETGVGLLFNMMYNSELGLLNAFLDLVHLSGLKRARLSEERTVVLALIIVVMWKYVRYHMIIRLTVMESVPGSLFEAARIDGITTWQQFTKITYPLIKHMIGIDVVLIITGSLKYFDLVRTITKGGPNHTNEVMTAYMYYQRFRAMKLDYASAIGLILLVLCMLMIQGANRLTRAEKLEYQRGGRL